MKSKKIILVSHNGIGNLGGVERVCFYMKEILEKEYFVNTMVKPRFSFGKLNVFMYSFINTFKLLLRRNKFVISNSYQLFSFPSDISIHHGTSQGTINNVPGFDCFSARIIALLEKISAKFAKTVISVSKNCTNELIELYGISPSKIITLNNFVDGNIFHPILKDRSEKECLKIIFSGRISLRKGIGELLKLSDYIESISGVKLLIACNDDENTNLFSDKINTEIRIGLNFRDMNDFYNSGDVFYFPTLYEGFSMATLEALSCGLPVLGTKFAIPDELSQYEFCKITNNFSPADIVNAAFELCEKFKNRKEEIHKIINADFGKLQYSEKLHLIISERISCDV